MLAVEDIKVNLNESKKEVYTSKRFLILAIFSLCQIMNCMAWMQFAGIINKMIFAYEHDGCTIGKLNYMSFSYMIMFAPVNFFATWYTDTRGMRPTLIIGVALQCVGFWIRTLANTSFSTVVIGQSIIAIGQPFIYNLSAEISAVWFPKNERVISTTIAVNMAIVGCIAGFFLPIVMV